MPAPREILDLVARFEQQLDAYKSGQYNETQLRREFLDPFFKALGWDIDNEQGYAEAYKDVIHEDAIRMGSATKAPDYCFRIGGTRKFFLEAKKPSVDIKQDISPAHQLRSYGWSAKLPLSILSDFEELAVYDCRIKPHKDDKASLGRIFYCTFREYAGKWDWLVSIFSRDAVLKGSFDKFAESGRGKRGTTEVDAAFLAEIEGWRKEIAQNLALRNPKLTQRELNFAVQRIIDRIIFLRICEDRGIEDYGRLRALVNGERIYPRLTKLFEDADARYNSGLFHFKKEPGRHEDPDELTLALDLDDKLLREILRGLYYPECPYQFSVLSADILGQVYEQFLGTVIRLTDGHHAVPELKPEVRKAGGVYYTPTYIVDYIVRQTVGKLLDEAMGSAGASPAAGGAPADGSSPVAPKGLREGAQPDTRGACAPLSSRAATAVLSRVAKLRILDPACGSGSFLIGAYQFLLDWHLQFYLANNPARWAKGGKPALVQSGKGWKLTIAERKRILLANIYGVDIDTQAVEVTKLSLLLKVLEGETGQTLQTIFRLFQERALPDLGDNIKCGNSLIGPDFYQQGELPLLTDDEKYRINVFDWHKEFPQIFRRRRGNESQTSSGELRDAPPPLDYTVPGVPLHGKYSTRKIKEKTVPPAPIEPEWEGGFDAVIGNPPYVRMEELKQVKDYLRKYESFEPRADLYTYFIEQETNLLHVDGKFGMIVSNKWMKARYGGPLRKFIAENLEIRELIDFGELRVFTSASTFPCILTADKSPQKTKSQPVKFRYVPIQELEPTELSKQVARDGFIVKEGPKHLEESWRLAHETVLTRLLTYPKGFVALERWLGKSLIGWGIKTGLNEAFVLSESEAKKWLKATPKLREVVKPLLIGDEVRRYSTVSPDQYLIYASRGFNLDGFAHVKEHLCSFRGPLAKRATAGTHPWYELQQPQPKYGEMFEVEKIVWPEIAKEPRFTVVGPGIYLNNKCFFTDCTSRLLLGILNSRLAWEILKLMCSCLGDVNKGGRLELRQQYLARFPMPEICDKSAHDRMVKLVEQMLELHPKLAGARTPQEKTALERQIAATDAQIDALVYALYGLTAEEIAIVEGTK